MKAFYLTDDYLPHVIVEWVIDDASNRRDKGDEDYERCLEDLFDYINYKKFFGINKIELIPPFLDAIDELKAKFPRFKGWCNYTPRSFPIWDFCEMEMQHCLHLDTDDLWSWTSDKVLVKRKDYETVDFSSPSYKRVPNSWFWSDYDGTLRSNGYEIIKLYDYIVNHSKNSEFASYYRREKNRLFPRKRIQTLTL